MNYLTIPEGAVLNVLDRQAANDLNIIMFTVLIWFGAWMVRWFIEAVTEPNQS